MGLFHLGSGLSSSVLSSGLPLLTFASSHGVKRHSAFVSAACYRFAPSFS